MTNLVETFIEDVRMAEQLSGSNRPLAIGLLHPAEGDDDVRFYFFIGGVMHNAKAALACRRVQWPGWSI
jgi:hypothetical protein